MIDQLITFKSYLIFVIIPHLFFLSAILLRNLDIPNWAIRKYIHVVGLIIVAIYGILLASINDLIVVGIMVVGSMVLLTVKPIKLIPRLTNMSTRRGESNNESLFTVSITQITVWTIWYLLANHRWIFFGATMALALGDGLGEFIGKPFGDHKYTIFAEKSLEGSFAVFCGIFVSGLLTFQLFIDYTIFHIFVLFLTSLLLVFIESLSTSFIDNILLPIVYSIIFLKYLG